MNPLLAFTVPGDPLAQPRPRATRLGARAARLYQPRGPHASWRALVGIMAREAKRKSMAGRDAFPMSGPVEVGLRFLMPRPLEHYVARKPERGLRDGAPGWCDKLPDLDNLEKPVLDALTRAGIWRDDAQVAFVWKGKEYVTDGRPRLEVFVSSIVANPQLVAAYQWNQQPSAAN